jgi:fructuronate reductase
VSSPRLSRTAGQGRATAPVRLVHLGLGNFFRAHQCWYTEHAPDAADWGIAAFTGTSSPPLVDELNEQEGLYTLVSRAGDEDRFEVLSSLSRAHAVADHDAWLRYFEAPELAAVTITVTEAGYLRGAGGGLDVGRPDVQADIEALRSDPTGLVRTAPGRLVAGIAARRRAGAGALALVPCDNAPGNGALAEQVVRDLARLVHADLAAWFRDSVAVVTTMVDRITPRATPQDARTVLERHGVRRPLSRSSPSRCTSGCSAAKFPAGRPRWEDAGATFTDDVTPYEHRKLWLLNGAHSLLAYAGSIRGHATVAGAAADETCRSWLEEWWAVASPHLDQPAAGAGRCRRGRRRGRRTAPRCWRASPTRGCTTGWTGSPPTARRSSRSASCPSCAPSARRAWCPPPSTRVLAAWVCHLRGLGAPIRDTRAAEVVPLAAGPLGAAVPRVLRCAGPGARR